MTNNMEKHLAALEAHLGECEQIIPLIFPDWVCPGSPTAADLAAPPDADGCGKTKGRRYGCSYHHKRGATTCTNDVQIQQEVLNHALLHALSEALDERMIAAAVEQALAQLRSQREVQRTGGSPWSGSCRSSTRRRRTSWPR